MDAGAGTVSYRCPLAWSRPLLTFGIFTFALIQSGIEPPNGSTSLWLLSDSVAVQLQPRLVVESNASTTWIQFPACLQSRARFGLCKLSTNLPPKPGTCI
eukprot:GHVS01052289.1.p1 GENE.GHVS01052289.1~~GHVS01052289.1.p1  ORF type:complete len:100 (+),score=1.68 GHVS01052289.1:858-1157(+)